ncbi:MAG: acyl-CoA dehydratase activase [Candidatus Thorarchaeota archaeon]
MVSDFGVGVDVGSTTTKAVMVDHSGKVIASHLMMTGGTAANSASKCVEEITRKASVSPSDISIVSTGYGRAQVDGATQRITEITCHSIGVYHLNPQIAFLIDVGGQDSKVIRIGKNGRPQDFEINDKCSAGTGRFLEVMSRVLEKSLSELSSLALESTSPSTISSTCTVFAESEVIGRIGSGDSVQDIAAGIHLSMASKIATLSRRVGVIEPVCVTGGVALNPAFRFYLSKQLGFELWVPSEPQLTGALGAAVLALQD